MWPFLAVLAGVCLAILTVLSVCAGAVLKKGETLLLQERVDPSIIGGFIIDIGDKHIDMSISSRVKKVQQMILETAA